MLFKDKNTILDSAPVKIAGVFNSQVAIQPFQKILFLNMPTLVAIKMF